MQSLVWCTAGLLLSAAGTWAALGYARWRRLVDLPDERRNHSIPTPRGGGIGIVIASLAGVAVAVGLGFVAPFAALAFAAGLLLVAGVGWIDDHRPLSAWLRLLAHVLAGGVLALVPAVQGQWLLAACALMLVPALVNIWNFMDGINGIATIQTALCLLLVSLLLSAPATLPVVLALGACLGFLPFNFPRARIFLGDVGSGALGFVVAAAVVLVADRGDLRCVLVAMPAMPFLVDAGFTLARRMIRGERWWQAHSQHLYQRLVRRGHGHAAVALGYAGFSIVAVILALFIATLQVGWALALAATVGWFLFVAAAWFFLKDRTDAEESSGLE